MDLKSLPDRRTSRQTTTHSISPGAEDLRLHEKVPLHDKYGHNVAKHTATPLLPITGKKDQKYPSLTSVNFTQSNTLNISELLSKEKTLSKDKAWKESSPNTQAKDICPQKPPLKLAPLNLPEEVKEAQLQKMKAVKHEVYLVRKNPNPAGKTMKPFANLPMTRDPLVGLREENLTKFKTTNILLKDNTDSTVVSASREKKSDHTIDKTKNGQSQEEAPEDVTVKSTDGQNVLKKERFIYAKSHNTHPATRRAVHVDRLVIEHTDQTGGTKRTGEKKNQVKLMTPTLKI